MNKKGFTLTELLVVVVILGIVSGLSIPLIRNLTSTFEKKKYQNYADSVLAAAKLYNDSYGEDLFGHNEYGCSYITYDKLVEKKLIKDIQIEKTSCNSEKTYVRVTKIKDKYGYAVYLACGDKTEGKIEEAKVSIPTTIPPMNASSCTGTDPSNLVITADMTQTNAEADKNRKKTTLTIESGTGINNDTQIYAKWSKNANDHTNDGFTKVGFKIKGNQKNDILNGQLITSKSEELISPKGDGSYYLIVRVDRLEDLYGNPWKNPDEENGKFLVFGPFIVDNTKPTITANVYSCDENLHKSGQLRATQSNNGENTVFDLSSMPSTVNGWASSSYYSNGVCLEFIFNDNMSIKSAIWEWNRTGLTLADEDYTEFSSTRKSIQPFAGEQTATLEKSISGEGHRYGRITVKDYAGNKSSIDIDVKYDATGPSKPSIVSSSGGNWTNKDITLRLSSSDYISGIQDYYYTYNKDATETGTSGNDSGTKWIKLNGGTEETSFTTEKWERDMNKLVYIRVCDKAGNCSEKNSTPIKIDKHAPTIKANIYKATKNQGKDGTTPITSSNSGLSGTNNSMNLSNLKNNVNGWLNKANYPNGIYLEVEINDNLALGTTKWEWNRVGKRANESGYQELVTNKDYSYPNETTISDKSAQAIYDNGHRYAKFTVTDKAGNTTTITFDFKIDKVKPSAPTLTNPTGGDWVNHDFDLTIKGDDGMSGIGKYYYTYTDSPSGFGDDDYSQWVKYKTENTNTLIDTWSSERDDTVYIMVCDKAGNCSDSSSTRIRIDRTDPRCGTVDYYSWTQYQTSGVSGDVGCYDYESGCVDDGYFENEKDDGYVKIEDEAGNTNYCEIDIDSICTDGHCGSYFTPVCVGSSGSGAGLQQGNITGPGWYEEDCQDWCEGDTNGVDYKWIKNRVDGNTLYYSCRNLHDTSDIGNCVWSDMEWDFVWGPLGGAGGGDIYGGYNTYGEPIDWYEDTGCCGCCWNNQVVCDERIYY